MKSKLKKSLLTLLPISMVIASDVISKNWASNLEDAHSIGIFKLQLVFNYGMMMGSFSELSINAKSSILFTLGSFIFAAYVFCLWLIPIRSKATILGLSVLVGGIMGNIIDRFDDQKVVDFLSLNLGTGNLPYLNLADVFQLIGYGLVTLGVYRDSLYYWPKNDWRLKYIINHKFQIRWSLLISSVTFFTSAITLIFSYSFLKMDHSELTLKSYFAIGVSVSLCLSLVTFFMSLMITHRVAGPVYAVQRQMKFMLRGEFKQFKLRNNDEFKELERTVNLLQEEYHILHTISHKEEIDNVVDITKKSKHKAA
jgi:signal peptidase II